MRHEAKDKQLAVPLNKKPADDATAVADYLGAAAEKHFANIETKHAGCLVAAEAAKAKAQQTGVG